MLRAKAQAAALALALLAPAGRAAQPLGRWEKLPLPGKASSTLYDLAVAQDGTLWIVASGYLYRWDGERFVAPSTGRLALSSYYLSRLFGGGDRPLYASSRGSAKREGRLHRLADGGAELVTTFRYATSSQRPSLHAARSGAVLNWGSDFVAVYSGGQWQRTDARLGRRCIVVEQGDAVHLFYQGTLYTYDGKLSERSMVSALVAEQGSALGARLGDRTLLTATPGDEGIRLYALPSLRPDLAAASRAAVDALAVCDVLGARDGSVYLCVDEPDDGPRILHRVRPDGRVERLDATVGIEWPTGRTWSYPRTVLSASDGSLWLGLPYSGVVRVAGGALRQFTWRDGLGCAARCLAEGAEGRIYVGGRRALYVFHPGEPPGPPPADVGLWQILDLASCYPIRDRDGNVWMLRKDQAGKLSRWDGEAWRHVAVPFDTSKVRHAMADDRGRVLLVADEGAYIVGPAGVERHEDFRAMLQWAIVDGATRFDTGPSLLGCVVLDGGRIWYGAYGSRRVHYYDGATWTTQPFLNDIYGILMSVEHGMLFRGEGSRFYTHKDGWRQALRVTRSRYSRWLLGPHGYQPFEQALLAKHPGRYAPVQIDADGDYRLLVPGDGDDLARGSQLSSSVRAATPGYHGGHWSAHVRGGSSLRRLFAGRSLTCDLSDSPIAGWDYTIRQVIEDRAHNLWLCPGPHGDARHVALKRLSGFRLKVGPVPGEVVRTTAVAAEPVLPGLDADAMRLFWRIGGGPWRYGSGGGAATIRFPTTGDYTIELLGMDRLGGTTATHERVRVHARVPLPETTLTGKGPFKARDVLWEPPVAMTPSERGATPYLVYRIDGGTWRLARSRRHVLFGRLSAGTHRVELAAREQGRYRDATPLSLSVVYAPNPEHIVASRLKLLTSSSAKVVARAQSDIVLAGPMVASAVERHLAAAKDQPELAARLQALLTRLRAPAAKP